MYSPPTLNERRAFRAEYHHLVSFLTYFLDLYDEVKPLQEIIDSCLASSEFDYELKLITVREGRAFMRQNTLPWTLISKTSNRVFETKEETYAWLTDALNQIEATLRS